jgi:hypothetical protein
MTLPREISNHNFFAFLWHAVFLAFVHRFCRGREYLACCFSIGRGLDNKPFRFPVFFYPISIVYFLSGLFYTENRLSTIVGDPPVEPHGQARGTTLFRRFALRTAGLRGTASRSPQSALRIHPRLKPWPSASGVKIMAIIGYDNVQLTP